MTVRASQLASLAALAFVCAACGGGLRLTRIESARGKPSNVAVFFAVEDAEGEPVVGLRASHFQIHEDGELVPPAESQQTLIKPEQVAVNRTLLLVDMSGSVSESDQLSEIIDAASAFVAQIHPHQRIALYAFDGEQSIHEIVPFAPEKRPLPDALTALASFRSKDPETNLHGAVVQALSKIDEALKRDTLPLRFGTLVVFTNGTDRASRVPLQEMIDAIEAADYDLFAIGVGDEIDDATLARIGQSGYIRVADSGALQGAFKQIGERIVGYAQRLYLLSYCSPARSGVHTLTIEAERDGRSGRLRVEFDATGFGSGCSAATPPPFDAGSSAPRSRRKLGLTLEAGEPD